MILTVFQATPKMSTHMLALLISEMSCDSGDNIDSVLMYQVCSRDKVAGDRALAVSKGANFIKILEDYTGIQYNDFSVGKLDFFTLPNHFTVGAENWGLITFR